jgi:CHAT domain/TIR domain
MREWPIRDRHTKERVVTGRDFFISYTTVDRAWAEWIAWQLEAAGYSTLVQAWDFSAGRDWVHEMDQATMTATRTIAVLSPAYLQSVYGGAEWQAAFRKDPTGERGLLIPVRVASVGLQRLPGTRVYVDLVDLDAEAARQALLAAIEQRRAKPSREPRYPGAKLDAPVFPGSTIPPNKEAEALHASTAMPTEPHEERVERFQYEDFDLVIKPIERDTYSARIIRSPVGKSTPVQFKLPFSSIDLDNFLLRINRPRPATRGSGRSEVDLLKTFGGQLYNAVFHDELQETLLRSLNQTASQGTGLRLRLHLADSPELVGLPWEYLYDSHRNRFLALSRRTPLVRYLDLSDPPRPLTVRGSLRLLVMIASPADYPPLDAEQEWSMIREALADLQTAGRVVVERLELPTLSALQQELRHGEYHIFHFIGHGGFTGWHGGVLLMEDRKGRSLEISGEELGGLLNDHDPMRLAVLNAAEGARTDAADLFAGMAQSLIQQGVPAVVAMQSEISDQSAIIFSHEVYGAMADGYPLDAALAEARRVIRNEGNELEWGIPVLYLRAPNGRIFDVVETPSL